MSTVMTKKKKLNFMKGQMVYLRITHGEDKGKINERNLYQIRNIGPKMCTLDRIDSKTHERLSYRGSNYYCVEQAVAQERNAQGRYWGFAIWDWSQLMVPIGSAGWDADMNF